MSEQALERLFDVEKDVALHTNLFLLIVGAVLGFSTNVLTAEHFDWSRPVAIYVSLLAVVAGLFGLLSLRSSRRSRALRAKWRVMMDLRDTAAECRAEGFAILRLSGRTADDLPLPSSPTSLGSDCPSALTIMMGHNGVGGLSRPKMVNGASWRTAGNVQVVSARTGGHCGPPTCDPAGSTTRAPPAPHSNRWPGSPSGSATAPSL